MPHDRRLRVCFKIVFKSVDSQKFIFGVRLKKTKAILGCYNFAKAGLNILDLL